MSELCVFCLSKDRKLHPILEEHWNTIFSLIDADDAEFLRQLASPRHCWLCSAQVRASAGWRRDARAALRLLREYNVAHSELPSTSRLSTTRAEVVSFPARAAPDTDAERSVTSADTTLPVHKEDKDVFAQVKQEFDGQPEKPLAEYDPSSGDIKQETDDFNYEPAPSSDDDVALATRASSASKKKSGELRLRKSFKSYTVWSMSHSAAIRQYRECERDRHASLTHAEKQSESSGPHECDICKHKFIKQCLLKKHIQTHYVLYKCKKCEYETTRLESMRKHKHEHRTQTEDAPNGLKEEPSDTENDRRECKKCKVSFASRASLRTHRTSCTVFKCEWCEKTFSHRTSKYSHMDLHHKPLPAVECHICNKQFKNKYAIKSHLQKHRREARGALYYCQMCSIDFKTAILFRQHFYRDLQHGVEYRTECWHCSLKFSHSKRLQEHVSNVHVKRGVYKCDHCFKSYMQKKALETHLLTKHSSGKAPAARDKICDVCGKGFTSSTILRNHQRSHTGEKPYQCAHCPATFGHTGSLYTHNKLVHKKKGVSKEGAVDAPTFLCGACNKEFVSEAKLKSHYDFFHLKKSEFVCEICNKIFISAWNLKNHRTMLHGINRTRAFPCSVCGKDFFRIDALKSHKLIHSEERTFMCCECGKTFKQQAALYTHNKLVHKGIKRPAKSRQRGKKPSLAPEVDPEHMPEPDKFL